MAAKAKSQATISFVRKPKVKRPGVHAKTKFSKSKNSMPIIQEVTEKKFLTEEEKTTLKDLQTKTESIVVELGEISLIKIQVENRYESAKSYLTEISNQEKEFTKTLFDKYGKFNLDPETGEIIKSN